MCVCVQVERPPSPVSQLPPVPPRLDLLQQRPSSSHSAQGQGATPKVCVSICMSVSFSPRLWIRTKQYVHSHRYISGVIGHCKCSFSKIAVKTKNKNTFPNEISTEELEDIIYSLHSVQKVHSYFLLTSKISHVHLNNYLHIKQVHIKVEVKFL